jgi:hypothetical protein
MIARRVALVLERDTGWPRPVKNGGPALYQSAGPEKLIFLLFQNVSNALNLKNAKHYLPEVQKFPNLSWWYISSNRTNFLVLSTPKSLWIFNYKI